MRVVGGLAGGVPLQVPKKAGETLRPTMDMVKNAIFSVLGESVVDVEVLDLFAGVGGLGIEALSRGAKSCAFVECDRKACEAIRSNLQKTRLEGGTVIPADALTWLDRSAGVEEFDLVLADPPYAKNAGDRDFAAELLTQVGLHRCLRAGGILVLEHLPEGAMVETHLWECVRSKRYGATAVSFFKPLRMAESEASRE